MLHTTDALNCYICLKKCYSVLMGILHDNRLKAQRSPRKSCISQASPISGGAGTAVNKRLPYLPLETLLTTAAHCGPLSGNEAATSGLCPGSELQFLPSSGQRKHYGHLSGLQMSGQLLLSFFVYLSVMSHFWMQARDTGCV